MPGEVGVLLPGGGYVMTVYSAYLDESGTDAGSNVLCVAGYLFRCDRARLMERRWKNVLFRYRVPYFHMADCAVDPGFGVFKTFTKPQRIAIQTELINLIKEYSTFGFASVVNPNRHVKNRSASNPLLPDAYTFCLHVTMMALSRIPINLDDKVTLFFERGHENAGKAELYLQNAVLPESVVHHSYAKKGEIHLLEAADILAWQCTKHIKDRVSSIRKPRKDFLSLMESRHNFSYLDFTNQTAIAQDKDPKRENAKLDNYLKALFSSGPESDAELEKAQDAFRFRFDPVTQSIRPREEVKTSH